MLVQDDAHVEVLRVGPEAETLGLTLERTVPVDPMLRGARDGTPYPYWFDVVVPHSGTEVLASFHWHLTGAGVDRMRERGLPLRFPAVLRRGRAHYFAGDFADNPLDATRVPLAGFAAAKRWLEGAKLAPSEDAFFWRFYAPMMTELLAALPTLVESSAREVTMLGNQRGGAGARILLVLLLVCGITFVALAAFRAGAGSPRRHRARPQGNRAPHAGDGHGGRRRARPPRRRGGGGAVQGDRRQVLATKSYTPRPPWAFWGERTERDRLQVEVGRETVKGLKPGTATIRVEAARAGAWLRSPDPTVASLDLPVRLNPPALSPQSDAVYVSQGGSECVVYHVGESSVRDGVQAGGAFFPGHPLPGGAPGIKRRCSPFLST